MQYLNMKNYPSIKSFPYEYTLVAPLEKTLRFDSRFESGNLHKAIKVSENEYNLLLDYDTETEGFTQWYYFSVKNYKQGHTVRFNIINLMKYESLYNNGMKPLVYSSYKASLNQIGWHRDCCSISYYQNNLPRKVLLSSMINNKYYYSLSFSYTFQYSEDTVYFAHCYPYTNTQLTDYLNSLSSNHSYDKFLRINPLCKTITGNTCFILTITHNIKSYNTWDEEFNKINRTAAGRRFIKLKELKEELLKYGKNDEGKS